MNKWSEIKQAALNTIFVDESEALNQNYLQKFPYLANECLVTIANSVKPKVAPFEIYIPDTTLFRVIDGANFSYDKEKNKIIYGDDATEIDPSETVIYKESDDVKYVFHNKDLIKLVKPGDHVKMPKDFISYYDVVDYIDGDNADTHITYIGRDEIALDNYGDYTIYYNALWKEISKDDMDNDVELEIDPSILNCLPSYIASRVLMVDDVQRAMIYKNDFELQLSRLDNTTLCQNEHYRSTGGWY